MRGNAVCDVDERVEEHECHRSHLDNAASSSLDWPALFKAGLCTATCEEEEGQASGVYSER